MKLLLFVIGLAAFVLAFIAFNKKKKVVEVVEEEFQPNGSSESVVFSTEQIEEDVKFSKKEKVQPKAKMEVKKKPTAKPTTKPKNKQSKF
jgi:hypothetical protein